MHTMNIDLHKVLSSARCVNIVGTVPKDAEMNSLNICKEKN